MPTLLSSLSREALPWEHRSVKTCVADTSISFNHSLHLSQNTALLPPCRAPISHFTSELSQPCRSFLANTLSYNGCIDTYRYRANFTENLWRVYLNSPRELWRNTHDVIRLLDAKGRTVDALAY